jgi:uncharacterized Zn finger protein
MRENAAVKGRRYLTEGRLTVRVISPNAVEATCRGDSGVVYTVGFDAGRDYCSCPAVGRCSHLAAPCHYREDLGTGGEYREA